VVVAICTKNKGEGCKQQSQIIIHLPNDGVFMGGLYDPWWSEGQPQRHHKPVWEDEEGRSWGKTQYFWGLNG